MGNTRLRLPLYSQRWIDISVLGTIQIMFENYGDICLIMGVFLVVEDLNGDGLCSKFMVITCTNLFTSLPFSMCKFVYDFSCVL